MLYITYVVMYYDYMFVRTHVKRVYGVFILCNVLLARWYVYKVWYSGVRCYVFCNIIDNVCIIPCCVLVVRAMVLCTAIASLYGCATII